MAPKAYAGQCHCGQVKFTATLPEPLAPEGEGKINRCNCSICTKNGYYLVYPKVEDLKFIDGSDSNMKSYLMGNKVFPHKFCPKCSSSILIDFEKAPDGFPMKGQYGLNAALFNDIDLENASLRTFDGRKVLKPHYDGYSKSS